jgi:hypothetical protein
MMTAEEVRNLISSTGFYFDPEHPDFIESSKKEQLTPPFLEYELEDVNFFADGIIYFKRKKLTIRLYTDVYDKDAESTLEAALQEAGIGFSKEKQYFNSIGLWESGYQTEV